MTTALAFPYFTTAGVAATVGAIAVLAVTEAERRTSVVIVGVTVIPTALELVDLAPVIADTDGEVATDAVVALETVELAAVVVVTVVLAVTGPCVRDIDAVDVGLVVTPIAVIGFVILAGTAVVTGLVAALPVEVSTIGDGATSVVGVMVTGTADAVFVIKPELADDVRVIVTSAVD
jgi:hypothetical protein